LSTTNLVEFALYEIPRFGNLKGISLQAIVAALAELANLQSLTIKFQDSWFRPKLQSLHPPSPTRRILPALTRFADYGAGDYLDELVARIDAPLLDSIWITFLRSPQFIIDVPELTPFMRSATKFQALNEAHVVARILGVQIESLPPIRTYEVKPGLGIFCDTCGVSDLAQVFTLLFPSIYTVEHLYIYQPQIFPLKWQNATVNMELFHPFTAVKNLYISKEFAQYIAPALQELVGERVTDVLPALESLFLEELEPSGPVQEAIGQFTAARQLLGRPVTISHWNGTTA
jgi:hypothetical protein